MNCSSFKIIYFLILFFCVETYSQNSSNEDLRHFKQKLESYFELAYHDSIIQSSKTIKIFSFTNSKDSLTGSQITHLVANSFYNTHNFFKSIEFYNQSIELAPHSDTGKNQKGIALYDKAFAEYEIQNYYKSYQTVKKAEAILSDLKQPDLDYLISIYADLGNEASYLGFYDEAEFYLNKGFRLYNSNKAELSNDQNQKASKSVLFHYKYVYLYYLKQDEKLLLQHLEKLESLQSSVPFNTTEKLMLAVSYNYVGDYYLNLYQNENSSSKTLLSKGNQFLNSSLKFLNIDSQKGNYTQVLFNKAKYYRHFGKFSEASNTNEKLCEIVGKDDERMPFFIAQKAMIALDQGQKKEALNYYNEMVNLIHSSDQNLKPDVSNFKPSSIVNHTGLLVEIADEFLEKFPNDSILARHFSKFYDLGLKQLSNSYEGEYFSESLKNYYDKALKGVLESRLNGFGKSRNLTLIEEIEQIENRLAWKAFLQNRTLKTNNVLSDSIFDKEIYLRRQLVAARSNNDTILINEINHSLNKHLRGLKENFPKIYKYVYSSFNINDFQKTLDQNTVVLKYKSIDSVMYVFKITHTNVSIESIPFDKNIKNQITNYIASIKNRESQKSIAEHIAKKILPFPIDSFENIIILPDDLLHFLPFETLVNNSGDYLIASHNFSYANHLVFATNNIREKGIETVAVFSPDYSTTNSQSLKGAEGESFYISKLFSNTMFFKEQASKTDFIQNADKADLIHLAMHAKINNVKPELSYFMFNDGNENERLYLEELYALKLKANLAVLGACNTGLGITENAKGSISLQRAFIMAGVPATISSLWEAPDLATKQIMTSFYTNLKNGQSKNLALKNAKLNYIQSAEDDSIITPYYWAGFIISGDYSAITKIESSNSSFILIICIIAIILVFLVFKLFKKF